MAASNVMALAIRGAGPDAKVALKLDASNSVLEPESKKIKLDKVCTKYGCVAGASSDFFPIYRRHRSIELERLATMDKNWDELKSAESFQEKRERAMMADDEATSKKSAKRQKRKENKKESEKLRKEAEGMNKFQGDGSWLEAMKSMSPEEFEKLAKKPVQVNPGVVQMPVISAAMMSASSNITIRDADF
mmetsp:Transcript_86752/g.221025  ORF Transcript_86752/g.221025 Transcript_86752/m.221025 type:complete len:190 (-) Transcript_86752:68-637(-)